MNPRQLATLILLAGFEFSPRVTLERFGIAAAGFHELDALGSIKQLKKKFNERNMQIANYSSEEK